MLVYQGHHGDKGAQCADVVLPGAAWAEKDGVYVISKGEFRWHAGPHSRRVMRARIGRFYVPFSETINKTLSFDSLNELREQMIAAVPVFANLDEIQPAKWAKFGRAAKLKSEPVEAGLKEFYMTCAISRASETMAECYQAVQAGKSAVAAEYAKVDGTIMMEQWLIEAAWIVAKILAVVVPLLIAVAYLTLAERRVIGFMQLRKGPNVVGPFGLFQPFADALKLMAKETILPAGADKVVFILAPMLTFILALVAWAVIPFDAGMVLADINVGILYLLLLALLAFMA